MPHPTQSNSMIFYNIRKNAKPLLELDVAQLQERMFSKTTDLNALGLERLGLTVLKTNQCEVIADLNENGALLDSFSINKKNLRETLDIIRSNEAIIEEKVTLLYSFQPANELEDSDVMIYSGGFFSQAEKREMEVFHTVVKAGQLKSYSIETSSSRLKEMIFKIKARNFSESLSEAEKETWNNYIKKRLTENSLKAELTLNEYQSALSDARRKASNTMENIILDEIEEYVSELMVKFV